MNKRQYGAPLTLTDGLCLLTKRLERGRFAWPSARDGKVF
ncbi:hypothetical protein C9287_24300, partial (plasmid) [Escherichia coli]